VCGCGCGTGARRRNNYAASGSGRSARARGTLRVFRQCRHDYRRRRYYQTFTPPQQEPLWISSTGSDGRRLGSREGTSRRKRTQRDADDGRGSVNGWRARAAIVFFARTDAFAVPFTCVRAKHSPAISIAGRARVRTTSVIGSQTVPSAFRRRERNRARLLLSYTFF